MKDLTSRGVVYGVKRCPTSLSTCSVILQPEAENGCEAIREYLPRILRQISTFEQVIAPSGSQPLVVNEMDENRSFADKRTQWNLLSGNTVSVIVGGR